MENSSKFLVAEDLAWTELGGGVRRKIMGYDSQLMVVLVEFEAGAIGSLHTHPHSQSSYIASGVFEVEIDGDKKILKQGDGYHVCADWVHGVRCIEAGTLVDSFSPVRADFLD